MIRLILADDHKILREALSSILEREPDIEVVGHAGDGETVLALARKLSPDVILMDIAMPGINGIDATRQIVAENPTVRVLALSTYTDKRFVVQMLEAGAIGYVNKSTGRDELLQGVRAVAAGKPYLPQDIAAMLVKQTRSEHHGGNAEVKLGRREEEVLQLIVEGLTSTKIGEKLHIATSTVEVHRRNIMRKLNLHSVVELTRYAIRQGLITP